MVSNKRRFRSTRKLDNYIQMLEVGNDNTENIADRINDMLFEGLLLCGLHIGMVYTSVIWAGKKHGYFIIQPSSLI